MSKIGIFLIHGFMETGENTYDLFLEELKKEEKFECKVIDLQGHSKEEDINDFNHKKCIYRVKRQYKDFKKEYHKTIIVGFSMGGVIASYLASEYGCDKLILFAPAFKYVFSTSLGKDLLSIFKEEGIGRLKSKVINNYNAKDLLEIVEEKYGSANVTIYDIFAKDRENLTINPFREFVFLVEKLKKEIIIKDIPTRIYIGEKDELVPISGAIEIYNKIECNNKRLIIFPNSYHRILKCPMYKEIVSEITEYILQEK